VYRWGERQKAIEMVGRSDSIVPKSSAIPWLLTLFVTRTGEHRSQLRRAKEKKLHYTASASAVWVAGHTSFTAPQAQISNRVVN
jgi:hypothetical protein